MSFSFGTPSSAPANSSLTGGFSFGANKPAALPGFGLGATSQPATGLFGSTPATSAPAFGASTSFGAAGTPAFGTGTTPGFGATSTAPTFGTGTPAFGATSTAPAFGSTSTFGATTAAPAFGATTTAPAFGTSNSSAFGTGLGTGGLNFGAGSNAAPSTGLTLGAPATTSAGLGGFGGFGATTQSTGLFGATSTASGGLFEGKMFQPREPPLIPITQSFQMLQPTTPSVSSSPKHTNRKYMYKSTTRDSYRTLGPTDGAKLGTTGTTTLAGGFTATTTQSAGLGGAAPFGTAATSSDSKTEPPKQTKVPNDIVSGVDSFKEFVKKQKSISAELMSVSVKPLYNVSREAELTLRAVQALSSEVSRARAHSRRLRASAATALSTAEALLNTTGDGECNLPPTYVTALVSELEQALQTCRRQLDVAERQVTAAPHTLTQQELTQGIRRMHESLVALAGRLQVAHSQVEAQKQQYLNLRKYILKDPTNVFETPTTTASLDQILLDAESSRKKTRTGRWTGASGSAVLTDPRAALGTNVQQLTGPSPFSYVGTTLSPFPTTTDSTGPSWQAPAPSAVSLAPRTPSFAPQSTESSTFTLQKPPGKRGKQ